MTVGRWRVPEHAHEIDIRRCHGIDKLLCWRHGKVDAALAWYSITLKAFKHVQGYGSGRSQDVFCNAVGRLMVSVTGSPASRGQNTDVYAVVDTTIQPGVAEKVIIGMDLQQLDCR